MYISGEDSKRVREGLLAIASAITKKTLTEQLIYSLKLEDSIYENDFSTNTKKLLAKFVGECLIINKSQ